MGVIYKITNLVNGKIYVGQTLCRPKKRWNEHCCAARKRSGNKLYFHRAMAKHGINNFKMEVIDTSDSPDDLSRKEREWIAALGTTDDKKGYNGTFGGEGFHASSPEVRQKIGAKTRARWQDPDVRRHYEHNVWTEERRAATAAKSREFFASPEGIAARETIRAKISKTYICEACKGVFNGSQWQKHSPRKCPAVPFAKVKRKTEATRLACGNAMRGTKRPLEEVARRTASVRNAWTPEKRAAWSERMRAAAASRPKIKRVISPEQRAKQSATMKGRKVRLGIKNCSEANRNVAEAAVRGWRNRRARAESSGQEGGLAILARAVD